MRRPVWGVVILVTVFGSLVFTGGVAHADVPSPLPWERTYIPETTLSLSAYQQELSATCQLTYDNPLADNNQWFKPKIAVLGDSVQNQARPASIADTAFRWRYQTYCGGSYGNVLDSGAIEGALSIDPDVLVAGFGSNNYSENFQPSPDKMAWLPLYFDSFLNRTDAARCRVIFNVPEAVYPGMQPLAQLVWLSLHQQANAIFDSIDHRAHPNVILIDWRAMTAQHPEYIFDDQHLSHAGVNARINAVLKAARYCYAPDSPPGVRAIAGNGMATVTWGALPAEEGVTQYRVTASTGQQVTTSDRTVNVPNLANGVPVQFSVAAINHGGAGAPSPWTPAVVPTGSGSRYHPLRPVRVFDTRDGTGGRATPFWPQEAMTIGVGAGLPPEAANAFGVVLNVTAAGQTADTFVTVSPGFEGRPFTSNLNPRPGIAAIPAMATTRLGLGRTVQLYNSSGFVHLIVDVVGWFDAPGTNSGALFTSLPPTRALDSRDGTGGRSSPFGASTSHLLAFPGLPPEATAVVVNVTTTNTTAPGFVTLSPAGESRPLASNVNPQPGLTRANLTMVKLGPSKQIEVFNNSNATDIVVDLVGYFGAPGAMSGGAEYFPISPERHVDSRIGLGWSGPVSSATTATIGFAGGGSIPNAANVTAIDANVTVVAPSQAGHTTVWPTGPRPTTSVLNFLANEVVANRNVIGLSGGEAQFWSVPSSIYYVVDVSGWYGPVLGGGSVAAPTVAPTTTGPVSATSTPSTSSSTTTSATVPATTGPSLSSSTSRSSTSTTPSRSRRRAGSPVGDQRE